MCINMTIKSFSVSCSCAGSCCRLVVEKYDLGEEGDSDYYYEITVQDNRYDGNSSLIQRIKNAFNILFGKPVVYNSFAFSDIFDKYNARVLDSVMSIDEFIENLKELRDYQGKF